MAKVNFNGEIEIADRSASWVEDQIKDLVRQYEGNVSVRTTTETDISRLKERIKEIVEDGYDVRDDGGIKLYCSYDDELSDGQIKEIMESNNPRQAFEEELCRFEASYDWGYMFNAIRQNLSETEIGVYNDNEDEIRDWLYDTYYFYLPEEHFNKSVKVNIMLDTGNLNYEFARDNVLNWDGRYSDGIFDKESSLLWLAKQQGKATLLRKCCKESWNRWMKDEQKWQKYADCEDKFVISAMQELANLPYAMGTMTFLVKMPLFTLFEIKELMKVESELNKSYTLEERKGKGYIVLDKSTMCGLFNPWGGGGSLLEIECEKDIKIPTRCIWDCVVDGTKMHGYDVDEVYGLVGSCWADTLKEIHK